MPQMEVDGERSVAGDSEAADDGLDVAGDAAADIQRPPSSTLPPGSSSPPHSDRLTTEVQVCVDTRVRSVEEHLQHGAKDGRIGGHHDPDVSRRSKSVR